MVCVCVCAYAYPLMCTKPGSRKGRGQAVGRRTAFYSSSGPKSIRGWPGWHSPLVRGNERLMQGDHSEEIL
jgi:hypothetical protein